MKHTKYILPIVVLMSLSSCGTKVVDRSTNKGVAPVGGTQLADNNSKIQALAKSLKKGKDNIKDLDEFGVVATSEGVQLELASAYLNGTLSLGEFTLTAGATNLVTGNKENTKVGLDFSGLTSNANLRSANNPAADDFDLITERSVGKCGAYLDNGNIYANLEGLQVPEAINEASKFVEPYLPTIIALTDMDKDLGTILTYFVSQFAVSSDNVTATIAPLFGKFDPTGFEYKFGFKNVYKDSDYPLLSKDDVVNDDNYEEAANQFATSFNEVSGLDFSEDLDMYTYDDGGLALALSLDKDDISKFLAKHIRTDFDYTIDEGVLSLALYVNGDGIPTSLSLVNDMKLTLSGEECDRRFGGNLAVKENVDFNVALDTESNPVNFPENYNDYNDLSFIGTILGGLAK